MLFESFNKKIYVQIASYLDLELYPTVEDLLKQASNPSNIFVSVFAQDEDFPDLEEIFARYPGIEYAYEKINYLKSKGVGFARSKANEHLSERFKYFLQVDSHCRFEPGWDRLIIDDYERLHKLWGKMIFSTYPPPYENDNNENYLTALKILTPYNETLPFDKTYVDYIGDEYGQESGYMCGGLVFGYTKHILEVPYDPRIYYEGEEHSMSVRFFEKGTKIVCPPSVYLYHDYDGSRRKRHWEMDNRWEIYDAISVFRLKQFFEGILDDQYSVKKETVDAFLEKFGS